MTERTYYDEELVQPGDTLEAFAARHAVDPQDVVDLNRDALERHAAVRGHAANFVRLVPDEHSQQYHEGKPVRSEVGYHVFSGERLRVREHAQ